MLFFYVIYYFDLQVEIPNGTYKGQKLMKLVAKKIPPKISRINPKVPEIVPVKYKTAITIAITLRMILSVEPMFFFIILRIN